MAWFSKKKTQPGWMVVSADTDAIRLAHIERPALGKPRVDHWGIVKRDEHGGAELQQTAKEHELGRYRCATLLHPAQYQLLMVDAPNVPRDELRAAIRWRVKDLLDYHIDDATMDVLDIPVEKDAPGKSHYMYAVAAKNEIVRDQVAQFERADIALQVIDVVETAQRNIAQLYETANRGIGMLTFDGTGGIFTLSFRGRTLSRAQTRHHLGATSQRTAKPSGRRTSSVLRWSCSVRSIISSASTRTSRCRNCCSGRCQKTSGCWSFCDRSCTCRCGRSILPTRLNSSAQDLGVDQQWQLFHVLGAALRVEAKAL